MPDSITTLESSVRFSQSLLWKYQRDYFERKGVDAWAKGEVPYYVTSNALIAYCYAQMAFRYLQDGLHNKTINPEFPIYMFELGTGSGKFSYLFLRKMTEFLKQFKLDHLKFCYVMTDFTESNLKFWQTQPELQEFVKKGVLDFAIYHIGEKQDIKLANQNIILSDNSCQNPIVAIGNYIFDTVVHDSFRVTEGALEEGLITTKTASDNMANDTVIAIDRLQSEFAFNKIQLPYYNNAALDDALAEYTKIISGAFLVPTGGIDSINNLCRLSNNRLLLISGDKAYTSVASMQNLGSPHIAFHGSFSMMVNFDFIGRYVKNLGGDAILAEDHEGFKISVFSVGQKFSQLPETVWAYDEFNTHFSTREFLELKNIVVKDVSLLNLEHIVALLKFSYWDTDVFMSVSSQLTKLVTKASSGFLRTLRKGLAVLSGNYYYIKNSKNVPFEIGHIYHLIGDLEDALKCYQLSLNYFGSDSATQFNLGLCYYYTKHPKTALEHFQKTIVIDPANKVAQEWIDYINKELNEK